MGFEAGQVKQAGGGFCKKVVVFKEAEEQEVACDRYTHQEAFLFPGAVEDGQAEVEINDGREQQQEKEAPVPPAIKKVAAEEQKCILNL